MSWIDNYRYSRNPVLFVLVAIFVLLNLVDIITAMYILPGEANPLFLLTGSLLPVFVGKLFVMGLAIWIYKQNKFPTNFQYFMILSFLTLGALLLTLGAASNIYGMFNPQIVAESAKISVEQKRTYYWQLISFLYIIPLILNLSIFKMYEKSVKKVLIKKEETKVWRKIKQWLRISQKKQ